LPLDPMSAEIDALGNLIAIQLQSIKNICSEKDATLPSIDDPDSAPASVMNDPGFVRAADVAIAAALRLIATLHNPHLSVQRIATGMYGSALINVAVEANITEALREAGSQGLHVDQLAPKVAMEPTKLGRVLRYLCGMHHMYREVSPNVFTNNRLSAALDTGKSFDEVKDRGPLRYAGSKGAAPFVGHTTDEVLRGAALLSDVLLDPKTAFSFDPAVTSTMKAVGYEGQYWNWVEQPEQKKRLHRFGEAMKNLDTIFPKEMIVDRYDWNSIPKGSLVVDVGGGLGGTTLPLAKTFSHLRYVIQDRPPVIVNAKKHWNNKFPEAIESGLVKFQDHNFFDPQPIKDASVFLLRFILHDWPHAEAAQILKRLRDVAKPDTKVVILDQVVPYTCPVEDDTITGKIPDVLKGNMAVGGGMSYATDIQMLNIQNSQERTTGEWADLAKASGFKVESIKSGLICAIVCVPV